MRLVLVVDGRRLRQNDDILALWESEEIVQFESGPLLLFEESESDVGEGLGVELEFTEPKNGGEYPWLASVGTLLLAARAGHLEGAGVGEAANVVVELDNRKKQASALIGYRLRTSAWLFDDDDEELLAGVVQAMEFGNTLRLTLEA